MRLNGRNRNGSNGWEKNLHFEMMDRKPQKQVCRFMRPVKNRWALSGRAMLNGRDAQIAVHYSKVGETDFLL